MLAVCRVCLALKAKLALAGRQVFQALQDLPAQRALALLALPGQRGNLAPLDPLERRDFEAQAASQVQLAAREPQASAESLVYKAQQAHLVKLA